MKNNSKQYSFQSWINLGTLISFVGLLLTLSPRPELVILVNQEKSNYEYVSTEIKNVGNAPAFDFKYNLFSEVKTDHGNFNIPNPQDPLFAKNILPAGQIFQGGRMTSANSEKNVRELLLRYDVRFKYSLFRIPLLDCIKGSSKVEGQLWWNGEKWDVR